MVKIIHMLPSNGYCSIEFIEWITTKERVSCFQPCHSRHSRHFHHSHQSHKRILSTSQRGGPCIHAELNVIKLAKDFQLLCALETNALLVREKKKIQFPLLHPVDQTQYITTTCSNDVRPTAPIPRGRA